ncbi:MAG: sensor domain-containing diguanylate cyclase [Candidatus Izemoplasmatales bacterium]
MINDLQDYTKEDLLIEVERLKKELLEERKLNNEEFLIQFPWAGNLGQWKWLYKENKVYFNNKKVTQLGYEPDLIGEIGFDFFTNKLHPSDYERVMGNMKDHLIGKSKAYEVEYRIQHKDGNYIWYYDRGTVTKRDSSGKPLVIQGVVFDITESKNIEEKLRNMSERDFLTNAYNRRTFYVKASEMIEKKDKQDISFSLVMFDIDHFKIINDTYGHLVGDDVLKQLTKIIIDDKRYEDLLFRYGGEEFFLLLPNTQIEGAIKLAVRLHKLIGEIEFPKIKHITVSMGLVEYQKNEGVDSMIKRVDDLMYEAKRSGRNQVKY